MGEHDFNAVKQEVKKLVSDITEIPEEDITEQARFVDDLGVDSMMALEIVARYEAAFRSAGAACPVGPAGVCPLRSSEGICCRR